MTTTQADASLEAPISSSNHSHSLTMKTINGSLIDPSPPSSDFVLFWKHCINSYEYCDQYCLKTYGYDSPDIFFGSEDSFKLFTETAKKFLTLIDLTDENNIKAATLKFVQEELFSSQIIYNNFMKRDLFLINLLLRKGFISQKQRIKNPFYVYFCHGLLLSSFTLFDNIESHELVTSDTSLRVSFAFFVDYLLLKEQAKLKDSSNKTDFKYYKELVGASLNDETDQTPLDNLRVESLKAARKVAAFTILSVDDRLLVKAAEFLKAVLSKKYPTTL